MIDHFLRWQRETRANTTLALFGRGTLSFAESAHVRMMGVVPDGEKLAAIARARALVMPSRHESLSMVVLEAWMMERPVLVNGDCEVLRGQVLRANGGLYYRRYEEFAAALDLLARAAGPRRRPRPAGPRLLPGPLRLAAGHGEVRPAARARGRRQPARFVTAGPGLEARLRHPALRAGGQRRGGAALPLAGRAPGAPAPGGGVRHPRARLPGVAEPLPRRATAVGERDPRPPLHGAPPAQRARLRLAVQPLLPRGAHARGGGGLGARERPLLARARQGGRPGPRPLRPLPLLLLPLLPQLPRPGRGARPGDPGAHRGGGPRDPPRHHEAFPALAPGHRLPDARGAGAGRGRERQPRPAAAS